MKINIRKSAIKDFKKIDRKEKDKIHSKILELSRFPDLPNIKKLTNFEPAYRLRIGDYRVLFDVTEAGIEIGRILHRKESYKTAR
jgi:mRNA interferase RelE/StbE